MDYSIVDGPPDLESGYLDEALQAYNVGFGPSSLLDISREIWDADNYYPMVVPFPTGANCFLNQPGSGFVFQTFAGDITIPAFSWLTKISHWSGKQVVEGPALHFTGVRSNFKLRVYDKGGKVDMIHRQFGWMGNVSSDMTGPGGMGAVDSPFGPYYLLEPKVLMPPGILHVEITDMSGVPCFVQVAFMFAVPRS